MLSSRVLLLLAVGAFICVIIGQFPARLALALGPAPMRKNFPARDVQGSIWSATLSDTQLSGIALGDLQARLTPLSLFTGHPRFAVSWQSRLSAGTAIAAMNEQVIAFSRVRARVVLSAVPLQGIAQISDGSVTAFDQTCQSAAGDVTVTLSSPGEALSGTLGCEAGALTLTARIAGERVTVPLRLSGQS